MSICVIPRLFHKIVLDSSMKLTQAKLTEKLRKEKIKNVWLGNNKEYSILETWNEEIIRFIKNSFKVYIEA